MSIDTTQIARQYHPHRRAMEAAGNVVQSILEEQKRWRKLIEPSYAMRSILDQVNEHQAFRRRYQDSVSLSAQLAITEVAQRNREFDRFADKAITALPSWQALGVVRSLETNTAATRAMDTMASLRRSADRMVTGEFPFALSEQAKRHAALLDSLPMPLADISRVSAYVEALRGPGLNVQESIRRLLGLAEIEPGDDDDDAISPVSARGAGGIRLRDLATATVIAADETIDQGWWASRPAIERFNTIIQLLAFFVALAAWMGEQGFNDEQVKDLLDTSSATQNTLERIADLEERTAKHHADSERYDAIILQSLAQINQRLAGRPCEALASTSLRALSPQGEVTHRLIPGQLALCLDHQGKWLEVIYESPGGEVRGWVLKKHFRLNGRPGHSRPPG